MQRNNVTGVKAFAMLTRVSKDTNIKLVDVAAGSSPNTKSECLAIASQKRVYQRVSEPMTGIEPAYSAWEAISTPERVSENSCSEAVPVTAISG